MIKNKRAKIKGRLERLRQIPTTLRQELQTLVHLKATKIAQNARTENEKANLSSTKTNLRTASLLITHPKKQEHSFPISRKSTTTLNQVSIQVFGNKLKLTMNRQFKNSRPRTNPVTDQNPEVIPAQLTPSVERRPTGLTRSSGKIVDREDSNAVAMAFKPKALSTQYESSSEKNDPLLQNSILVEGAFTGTLCKRRGKFRNDQSGFLQLVHTSSDTRSFWRFSNSRRNLHGIPSIVSLAAETASTPYEQCCLFAKHFSSVFIDPSSRTVPLADGLSYTPRDVFSSKSSNPLSTLPFSP